MTEVIPYLSTAEVAGAVGMTPGRVCQLAQKGEIRAEKFGRVWLIDPREVDRLRRDVPTTGRPRISKKK